MARKSNFGARNTLNQRMAVAGDLASKDKLTAEEQLTDLIGSCFADPLKHVMISYPWDTDPSIQVVKLPAKYRQRFNSEYGPDQWACDFLDDLGSEIKKRGFNGKDAVMPIQFSTASGHGIGKSVMAGFLVKFIMDTRPLSRGTITATTDTQLRTKTWAELGKWHNRSLTRHWFEYSSSRGNMSLRSTKSVMRNGVLVPLKEEWFCTAQTSKEENSEAFAGQHAANACSFYLFDEASGVPDKIFEVRKGGLTDGEPMVFDFGNPTRNTGAFFENCVGRERSRYVVRSIDSRSVQISNKSLINQWIEDYGIDSDFVKVRVLGQFPSQGTLQFIPTGWVELAKMRAVVQQRNDPLILGVDIARRGDDESVIYPRIGMDARSWPARRFRGQSTDQMVGHVLEMVSEFRQLGRTVSAIFVDMGNTGAAVYDYLVKLTPNVHGVWFSSNPTDRKTYRFKVDEMYGKMKDALEHRLSLPADNQPNGIELAAQLTQREFGYTLVGNRIQLESKEAMKDRLGADLGFSSPDIADALALTFAQDVGTIPAHLQQAAHTVQSDYDPLGVP